MSFALAPRAEPRDAPRMKRTAGWLIGACVVLALGCGDDGEVQDAASSTTGGEGSSGGQGSTGPASGTTDASSSSGTDMRASSSEGGNASSSSSTTGVADGSSSSSSSGGEDALGELMGRCGVLGDAELTGEMPGLFVNTLDFGDVGFDDDLLTPGGQQIFDDGNLGGSSLFSEIVAYEVLARCEGATLVKTEAEIVYDDDGPRTDLLVDFDGTPIGVSVVRAQGFPLEDPYTVEQASTILEDKLSDIPLSTAAVSDADAWEKQILHVVAYGPMHAQSLQTAYEALGPEVTLDTIVVVTVTEGDDLFIYTE